MAKASEADLDMAMTLTNALEALAGRWGAFMPEKIERLTGDRENEPFDITDHGQCMRVIEHLQSLVGSASLMRVVFGMAVLLDPKNRLVDPDKNHLEHPPEIIAAREAKPLDEWAEEDGAVLWWRFPIEEEPYIGHPNCDSWPGYHTHFTKLLLPEAPAANRSKQA